jgi:hypothetical protein
MSFRMEASDTRIRDQIREMYTVGKVYKYGIGMVGVWCSGQEIALSLKHTEACAFGNSSVEKYYFCA